MAQLAGSIEKDRAEFAKALDDDDLARSMGAHGERVSAPDELRPALERAVAADTCAVIHVAVDPARHLFAPGLMYFKEMHQEPAGE